MLLLVVRLCRYLLLLDARFDRADVGRQTGECREEGEDAGIGFGDEGWRGGGEGCGEFDDLDSMLVKLQEEGGGTYVA